MVREFTVQDLAEVRSLHERSCDFAFPNLVCPLYLAKVIVEEYHKILGYGCLRLTCEAIIGVDSNQPLRKRAQVTDELIRTGIYRSQKLGFKDMHAFLTGPSSFGKTLEKRYGFIEHQNPVLVLEV